MVVVVVAAAAAAAAFVAVIVVTVVVAKACLLLLVVRLVVFVPLALRFRHGLSCVEDIHELIHSQHTNTHRPNSNQA